jgi:hypothetical protein
VCSFWVVSRGSCLRICLCCLKTKCWASLFDRDVLVLIHGDLGNETIGHCHLFHFRTT